MEKINDNSEDLAENTTPIQYLLIGDISTNKIITEFSSTINSSQIKKEINQIFSKICKNQSKKFNQRNKITSKDTIYYYTIIKPNFLFLILVEDEYPEELVFELIDKINEEKITSMINEETQELNPNGRVELKTIVDSYQKKNEEDNNIELIKEKDTKDKIDSNIKIQEKKINDNEISSQNTEEIEDLQTKNDVLLMSGKKRKWSIRQLKIWKDYRVWLYLAVFVLILLIIIIVT